jgi:hypothetical protein
MWKTWCGNAEKIVRMAMIRSIEVSLGLDHPVGKYNRAIEPPLLARRPNLDALQQLYGTHVDPSGVPYVPNLADARTIPPDQLVTRFGRNWPIEHWWICGVRYFQASVTWRRGPKSASVVAAAAAAAAGAAAGTAAPARGDAVPGLPPRTGAEDAGRVVVVFVTPGSMHHHVFDDLEHVPMNKVPPAGSPPAPTPSGDPQGAPWIVHPSRSDDRFGSWIVGHRFHQLVDVPSHEPTHVGECPCPIKFSVQSGDVMAVQPLYEDGGVRASASY